VAIIYSALQGADQAPSRTASLPVRASSSDTSDLVAGELLGGEERLRDEALGRRARSTCWRSVEAFDAEHRDDVFEILVLARCEAARAVSCGWPTMLVSIFDASTVGQCR
jgi:hypothetical protein